MSNFTVDGNVESHITFLVTAASFIYGCQPLRKSESSPVWTVE
uniref:Uncharacterized protein n=1 Tax=Anguilla anguilla TaxID=7936 RepID=A0A0E9R003_ANGAN